jgi:uncharacterized C2H2 Zn-finger protein
MNTLSTLSIESKNGKWLRCPKCHHVLRQYKRSKFQFYCRRCNLFMWIQFSNYPLTRRLSVQ